MSASNRKLLLTALFTLGALCLWPRSLVAQDGGWSSPVTSPRTVEPKNRTEPDPATRALLAEENRKALKKDVERLYDLAAQLKTDVEKTESTTVLSLALVKKAKEIEKLAKHIEDVPSYELGLKQSSTGATLPVS